VPKAGLRAVTHGIRWLSGNRAVSQQQTTLIWVTNEYESRRLMNSANKSSQGKSLDRIYHIKPDPLVEILSDLPSSVAEVQRLIDTDRLRSLEAFLIDLGRWRPAPRARRKCG